MKSGWDEILREYNVYIRLEKRLSANTVEAYMRDAGMLAEFVRRTCNASPAEVTADTVETFMASLFDRNVVSSTQSRVLSGIKSFFRFMLVSGYVDSSPAEFTDHPKTAHLLPDTLSVEEIDAVIEAIEPAEPLGIRNRAIIETLYSCGLRVSELVELRYTDMFPSEGVLRVMGKGSKQRLVPVSEEAQRKLDAWSACRPSLPVKESESDRVFLNRRGRRLSRIMIFNIVREAVAAAGITKTVSPHTFRHSFATHLLMGGASVRQVQELLGHESIVTTEIYTHLSAAHLRRTLDEHHPLG